MPYELDEDQSYWDYGCGNTVVEAGEECDDGNFIDGDGCSASCLLEGSGINDDTNIDDPFIEAVCGNGLLEPGEECDDGNSSDGDGCSASCITEGNPDLPDCSGDPALCFGWCGDLILDTSTEECDDGNNVDGDGCSAMCEIETPNGGEECGNAIVEAGEECDDGNTADGDGCSSACMIEPPIIDPPFCDNQPIICQPGSTPIFDNLGCFLRCSGTCGDGVLDDDEICDDGNNVDGDGCSSDCQSEEEGTCGNGILESGEECDDGNYEDGDGCSSACEDENGGGGDCGNGVVESGEDCDDGNNSDGDGCSSTCELEGNPNCGDGYTDIFEGEQCDDGNRQDGDGCSQNCRIESCGNGSQEGTEECDDGNNSNGDGCDSQCRSEACGDGRVAANEECDDGNTRNDDGCSASCELECDPLVDPNCDNNNDTCGDGIVQDWEDCDPEDPLTKLFCDDSCRIGCDENIPDTNLDGFVDITDYYTIVNYANGINEPDPARPDVDGDGVICVSSSNSSCDENGTCSSIILPPSCDGEIVLAWLAANPFGFCHGCFYARQLERDFLKNRDGEYCLSENDARFAKTPDEARKIREYIEQHRGSPCVCGSDDLCENTAGFSAMETSAESASPLQAAETEPADTEPCDPNDRVAEQSMHILQEYCSECHYEGSTYPGIFGPEDITNLEHVREYEEEIAYVLGQGIMPPAGYPELSDDQKETIRRWDERNWYEPEPLRRGLSDADILRAIILDLRHVPAGKRLTTRYFVTGAGFGTNGSRENKEDIAATSLVLNSLHWGPDIVVPEPISLDQIRDEIPIGDIDRYEAVDEWIYRVDISEMWDLYRYQYGGRGLSVWPGWGKLGQAEGHSLYNTLRLGGHDPALGFNSRNHTLKGVAAAVMAATGTKVPYFRTKWFLANAPFDLLYYQVLGIDSKQQVQHAIGARLPHAYQHNCVSRGGLVHSGITGQNRMVDRVSTDVGYYWESYDSKTSEDTQNIVNRPLGPGLGFGGYNFESAWDPYLELFNFEHDGGEIIWSLPNGLQAYMLVDAADNRLERAPDDVVTIGDPNMMVEPGDTTVLNGIGCMVCHYEGLIEFTNDLPGAIRATNQYRNDKRLGKKVDGLYTDGFLGFLEEDRGQFAGARQDAFGGFDPAICESNGVTPREPLLATVRRGYSRVYLDDLAGMLGATPDQVRDYISSDDLLGNAFGGLLATPPVGLDPAVVRRNPLSLNRLNAIHLGVLEPQSLEPQ